jgi:YD repeat-containing protein
MSATTRTDGKGTTLLTRTYADPSDRYRPSSVRDGNSKTWNYTWDSFGNIQTAKTPRTTLTTYAWNYANFALGELISIQTTGKQATSFTYYEPSGLIATVTAPKPGTSGGTQNVTTTFSYDSHALFDNGCAWQPDEL